MGLTEEDKQWLVSQIGELRAELRGEIGELRGEIGELRGEMRREIGEVRGEIERVETRLLTEFHKWASPNEARQRTYSAALHALELEIHALQDRIAKLENRPRSAN
jgi:phage host-nuclease inhibitor protein Gam